MKKYLLSLLCFLACIPAFAQDSWTINTTYEAGYWNVNVNKQFFGEGEKPLPVVRISFPVGASMNPSKISTFENNITLTSPNGTVLQPVETKKVTFTHEYFDGELDGLQITYAEFPETGAYTATVPANCLTVPGEEGGNEAATFTLAYIYATVEGGDTPDVPAWDGVVEAPTITPADGYEFPAGGGKATITASKGCEVHYLLIMNGDVKNISTTENVVEVDITADAVLQAYSYVPENVEGYDGISQQGPTIRNYTVAKVGGGEQPEQPGTLAEPTANPGDNYEFPAGGGKVTLTAPEGYFVFYQRFKDEVGEEVYDNNYVYATVNPCEVEITGETYLFFGTINADRTDYTDGIVYHYTVAGQLPPTPELPELNIPTFSRGVGQYNVGTVVTITADERGTLKYRVNEGSVEGEWVECTTNVADYKFTKAGTFELQAVSVSTSDEFANSGNAYETYVIVGVDTPEGDKTIDLGFATFGLEGTEAGAKTVTASNVSFLISEGYRTNSEGTNYYQGYITNTTPIRIVKVAATKSYATQVLVAYFSNTPFTEAPKKGGEVFGSTWSVEGQEDANRTEVAPSEPSTYFLIKRTDGNDFRPDVVVTYTGLVGINEAQVAAQAAEGVYNLNGVRVNAENLTPGIYVVVKDGKASKMLVK